MEQRLHDLTHRMQGCFEVTTEDRAAFERQFAHAQQILTDEIDDIRKQSKLDVADQVRETLDRV